MNFRTTAFAALTLCCACTALHAQTMIGGGKTAPAFPIQITQSGSYKLAGNLSVPAGMNGIVISAPDVTLDLGGFTIQGPGKCSNFVCPPIGQSSGIWLNAGMNARIRNGSVVGFDFAGVRLSNGAAMVEDVTVTDNSYAGLYRSAFASNAPIHLKRIQATGNGIAGIWTDNAIIEAASASTNGTGIRAFGHVTITASAMSNNKSYGMYSNGPNGFDYVVMGGSQVFNNPTAFYVPPVSAGGNMLDTTAF